MDPRVHPEQLYSEQTGWSPDSAKNEDGVNHLLRLRGQSAGSAPADATPEWEERRKSPRLRCSGSAEIRVAGSDARMWGTLSDVSIHGCYVEMNNTFPVDTRMALVLSSCGIRIHTPGRVRATYPALGMGICFTETEPSQEMQLKRLLGLLSGRGAVAVGGRAREKDVRENEVKEMSSVKETVRAADPGALVAELTAFFAKNKLLSRAKFYEIAKRVR